VETQGGCRFLTNESVNSFCMEHRYQCQAGTVCSYGAYLTSGFGSTLSVFRDVSTAPEPFRPNVYFRYGCRKNVGSGCSADRECPSKCLNGTCAGFCGLRATPGPLPAGGDLPFSRIDDVCTEAGCGGNTWSIASFVKSVIDAEERESFDYLTSGARGTAAWYQSRSETAVRYAFPSGRALPLESYACYPERPADAKCDFHLQCASECCLWPADTVTSFPPSPLPSFRSPTDNGAGIGTCRPAADCEAFYRTH
jgi:hypothetical protein